MEFIKTPVSLTKLKPLTVSITTNCGAFLKIGIPDNLTCLLKNVYGGQEATVRIGHWTTDWLKIGKGEQQGCMLSPCSFNFYAGYIMRNTRLDESQTRIRIAGRNINNLRYTGDTNLMAEIEEELEFVNESERGEWKSWFKLNSHKTNIMASSLITSWQMRKNWKQ